MTAEQITKLLCPQALPYPASKVTLIETHISWVILTDKFVYKLKKPLMLPFLDFSTLAKRKYYCIEEVNLNRRLTNGIYLGVLPVMKEGNNLSFGKGPGKVIDYAVVMRRLQLAKQMHFMLADNKVTQKHIHMLAKKIAAFHQQVPIINNPEKPQILKSKFNDLMIVRDFLGEQLPGTGPLIDQACVKSDAFIGQEKDLIIRRVANGMMRDGHGDLHSGNIFLYKDPIIFDCIEFNEAYRQNDVLNEVAFLCMDLELHGKRSLSESFLEYYLKCFPMEYGKEEERLFNYFKCFRANVRAKVNGLSANQQKGSARRRYLKEAAKYLDLMKQYLTKI